MSDWDRAVSAGAVALWGETSRDARAMAGLVLQAAAPIIEQMARDKAAAELEAFAAQCRRTAESVADQMTECANWSNLGTVETFWQAANIARAGVDYRNANCSNCKDTRGGPKEHSTEECAWSPREGLFDERDQCQGRRGHG